MAHRLVKEVIQHMVQDVVSFEVFSKFFKNDPLFSIMVMQDGMSNREIKKNLSRPGLGFLIGGKNLTPAMKNKIINGAAYTPEVQTAEAPNVTKIMDSRDTRPELSGTQSQIDPFGTVMFRRFEMQSHIRIWHDDLKEIERAGGGIRTVEGSAMELGTKATRLAVEDQRRNFSTQLFTGGYGAYAFNQNLRKWRGLLGLLSLFLGDVYAGVNRAEPGGTFFKTRKITDAMAPDIIEFVREVRLGAGGTSEYGLKPSVVFCSKKKFSHYVTQLQSKSWVSLTRGVQDMAEFGVEQDILNVDGTWVTYLNQLEGDYANYQFALRMDDLFLGFASDQNFTATPFNDQSTNDGGKIADSAYLETSAMFGAHSPHLHCIATNVADPE